MAINEAYNVDCIEYMRTLPDGYFDLAVCDPPYGSGNDTKLGGAKGSAEYSTGTAKWNRLKGGWAEKYYSPQKLGGGQNDSEKDSKDTSSRNRFQGGTWSTRYRVPMGGVLN